MAVITYEGVVEKGKIRLKAGVKLPENAKNLSEYYYVEQDLSTSHVNKGEPILRLFTPASSDTTSFCQPRKSSFNNPASGWETLFAWNGTFFFRFIASASVLNMFNVIPETNKLMYVFIVVAFVSTKMLLSMRTFGNDVNNQVIGRPFVMFIRTRDKNCEWRTAFIHQQMNFTAQFTAVGWIFASF